MLETYISHKEVQAEPMSRKDGVRLGLVRDVVTPENVNDKGFRVVYKDGYESWSPKDAFDEGYNKKETK